jgi:hypothetical protein
VIGNKDRGAVQAAEQVTLQYGQPAEAGQSREAHAGLKAARIRRIPETGPTPLP